MKLPKGWTQCSLLDCMKLVSGGTPSKERSDYWGGGIPWVSSKDMKVGRINDTEDHLTELGAENGTRLVPKNTILFVVRGMILARDFPVALTKRTVAFNQDLKAVETVDRVDTEFLYQWLKGNSNLILNGADEAGHGTKRLETNQLLGLPISVPPINEQRKIAEILGAWDDGLEKLDALIAAKERCKKGLMQRLLTGKGRVKGFAKKWERTTFGDLLHESRNPGSHGLIAHKITVKLYGKGVYAKQERMVGSPNTKYFVRHAGQFIYSKLDFLNGAFGIVPPLLDGFESTQDLPAFDVAKKCDARWLLAYVARPEFYTHQLGAAAGGRKARRVNPPEFLALPLSLPDLPEQRAIADILDACDEELRLLRDRRAAVERQKRGLMQRLLTGRTRTHGEEHGHTD